jgi:hypothetical protein
MLALKRTPSALLFALLLFPVLSHAQSLSYAKPEDVGFSRERLDRIVSTLNADIAKGTIPGAEEVGVLIHLCDGCSRQESIGQARSMAHQILHSDGPHRRHQIDTWHPDFSTATFMSAKAGMYFWTGSFRNSLPCSTKIIAATEVIGLRWPGLSDIHSPL